MKSRELAPDAHARRLLVGRFAVVAALVLILLSTASAHAGDDIFLYDGVETRRIHEQSRRIYGFEIGDEGEAAWSAYDGEDYEIFLYREGEVTQLSDNEGNDIHPEFGPAGHVVWRGGVGSDYEIFLYDGIEVRQLSDNYWDDCCPVVNARGQVAWNGQISRGGSYDVYFFDGNDVLRLTDNELPDGSPRINDHGWVVWSGSGGADHEIVLYDGTGKKALTRNGWDDGCPRINAVDQVVWVGWGDREGIFMYEEGEVLELSSHDSVDGCPSMNDAGDVVWSERDGQETDVFLFREETVIRLSDSQWSDGDPEINAAGTVVWSGEKDDQWDVFLFDGEEVLRLSESERSGNRPEIRLNPAGQVVWSGWDGTDWEIFLYDGAEVRQLTDDAYDDESPRINALGQVAWISSGRCSDGDGDGYGYEDEDFSACTRRAADCDDYDPAANPGAREGPDGDPTCSDGIDNDCDGLSDEEDGGCFWDLSCRDRDGDGFGEPASPACPFAQRDCDDSDPLLNPGVREVCDNGRDDDCDGFQDGDDPECGAEVWEFETIEGELGGPRAVLLFGEMVLDAEDNAHVVYYDEGVAELRYATNASGAWTAETVQVDADVPVHLALAADPEGGVCFVYREWTTGLAWYGSNLSGAWELDLIEDLPPPVVFYEGEEFEMRAEGDMAVSDSGVVHALHWEGDPEEYFGVLLFFSGTPGAMESEVLAAVSPAWVVTGDNLAIGPAGEVHALYLRSDEGHGCNLVHSVNRPAGWEEVVLSEDCPYGFIFQYWSRDLAVDDWGGAHLIVESVERPGLEFIFELGYYSDRWGAWGQQGSDVWRCGYFPCSSWPGQVASRDGTAYFAYAHVVGDCIDVSGDLACPVSLSLIKDLAGSRERTTVRELTGFEPFNPPPFGMPYELGRTIPLALDSRDRPHLCFHDPETGALMYATQRPPAFGQIGPAEGKGLTEAPVLSWQAGDREAFGLLLFLRLAGLGYQPITFWMERDRFPIPQPWWQAMVPDEPQFWLVFAYDAETGSLEASESRWFMKQE